MGSRFSRVLAGRLRQSRVEPTAKRVRGRLDGCTVVDGRRALLVWEPRRVVLAYPVPEAGLVRLQRRGVVRSVDIAGRLVEDLVWVCENRLDDAHALTGCLATSTSGST